MLALNDTRVSALDFALTALPCRGAVGDFVWHDLDEDGLQDEGEPGIEGVLMLLRDSEGEVISFQETGPNGVYAFMGLCPGTYSVEVDETTLPPDFSRTLCNAGPGPIDSECGQVPFTVLSNSWTDRSLDFGFVSEFNGRIGDFVWADTDCDGFQDIVVGLVGKFEPGVEGARVILRDDMSVIVSESTSNQDGNYEFTGLRPGMYSLEVDETTLPIGLVPSPCDPGLDDTSDNDCTGVEVTLTAEEFVGVSVTVIFDFGYRPNPCGGSGCSHGHWKNHTEDWGETYTPGTLFDDVFVDTFPGLTLHQVISQGGGGVNALGREAVAALLNAASVGGRLRALRRPGARALRGGGRRLGGGTSRRRRTTWSS